MNDVDMCWKRVSAVDSERCVYVFPIIYHDFRSNVY